MKHSIARMVSLVALVPLAKYYPPFGDDGLVVDVLNVVVFTIAFLLVERLISTKVR